MKVLVAVDESPDAQAAVRYGIQKVCELGGELITLHVFPKYLFDGHDAGQKAEQISRRESLDLLEGALKVIRENGRNIRTRLVMTDGRPEETIFEYAKEEDVDLIVSPPRFGSLIEKVCCLMDIVSAEEQAVSEGPVACIPPEALAAAWTRRCPPGVTGERHG
ncbi:MAG TPA: universal stress protein [Nitrospirota bacterium]|nr:universal stress protein [Nitrospirota bacterium]